MALFLCASRREYFVCSLFAPCAEFVQHTGHKPVHPCIYSLISVGVFKNSVVNYTISVVVFIIDATD